jgi:hypothetical protein
VLPGEKLNDFFLSGRDRVLPGANSLFFFHMIFFSFGSNYLLARDRGTVRGELSSNYSCVSVIGWGL